MALIAFFVPILALSLSACATLPQRVSSSAHIIHNQSKGESTVRLNINVATSSELEKLPGVGKVIAERIIAYRAEYGPFRRAEHLMMVRGISDRKFREMQPMIVVK